MIAFCDTSPIIQGVVFIFLTLIMIANIACVAYGVRIKTKLRYIFSSAAVFMSSFISLTVLYIGYVAKYRGLSPSAIVSAASHTAFFAAFLWATLLAALSVVWVIFLTRWQKTHLSAMSIKESIDELPSGVCLYNASGLPLLRNNEINSDCVEITGKALSNANDFWAALSQGEAVEGSRFVVSGENPIVRLKSGTVKSFIRNVRQSGKSVVYEIISTEITEEYVLSLKNENKNNLLKQLNARLRAYSKPITALTREKEILAAKIRIHDEIGRLLLTTQHSISEPNDRRAALSAWRQTVTAFGAVDDALTQSDAIGDLIETGKAIGVEIKYSGVRPTADKIAERLIATALHECLTNTVAHAVGNQINAVVKEDELTYTAQFTNNGKQPNADILEGGGLSSLRAYVERENGEMSVKSKPKFIMTIVVPKNGGSKNDG